MRLKSIIFPLVLSIFVSIGLSFADDTPTRPPLIEVKDLHALGQLSTSRKLPLLLMFSAEHCSYCKRVEEDFLVPMLISGDYTDRVLIRQVKLDGGNTLRDFDGESITPQTLGSRYAIFVTPTVVFLDGHGQQLAPKQVGLTTPDYYGGYLDESIATALDMLRRTTPLRAKLSVAN